MDRWTFSAMRDANREFAIRKEAERLGVTVDQVKAVLQAREDAKQEEGRRRYLIWEGEQKAAQRRFGEHVGLDVPLGVSRRRRSDSHRHLVALGTVVVGKHVRQEEEVICNGRTYFPGVVDFADSDDGPAEWLDLVSCPRCRRFAAKFMGVEPC